MQTDTESARLSNVQPYKFNTNQGAKGKVLGNQNVNIRKINPNTILLKPVVRDENNSVGAGLQASRGSNASNFKPNELHTISATPGGLEREFFSAGDQSVMSGASGLLDVKKINQTLDLG